MSNFRNKENILDLFTTLIALIIMFGSFWYIALKDKSPIEKIDIADVPEITIPDLGYGGPEPLDRVVLFDKDNVFIPGQDTFEAGVVISKMKNLVFIGDFMDAELVVKGSANDDLLHFISVTLDYQSGIYGVERLSIGKLKFDRDKGSVFTKDEPLDVRIDMMNKEKFSTSLNEQQKLGMSTYKMIRLWDAIQPPPNTKKATVAKILVVPFDENGIPSGQIDSLEIEYRCVEKGCQIKECISSPELSIEENEAECLKSL